MAGQRFAARRLSSGTSPDFSDPEESRRHQQQAPGSEGSPGGGGMAERWKLYVPRNLSSCGFCRRELEAHIRRKTKILDRFLQKHHPSLLNLFDKFEGADDSTAASSPTEAVRDDSGVNLDEEGAELAGSPKPKGGPPSNAASASSRVAFFLSKQGTSFDRDALAKLDESAASSDESCISYSDDETHKVVLEPFLLAGEPKTMELQRRRERLARASKEGTHMINRGGCPDKIQ